MTFIEKFGSGKENVSESRRNKSRNIKRGLDGKL
jgi:hypothetical protein